MEISEEINMENELAPELYFLIVKFLSRSPFEETYKVLVNELEKFKIFPKRLDWTGQEHEQSLAELERKFPHIGPSHLLEICSRVSPLLDKQLIPSVPGILSLLGAGRQCLLRTEESISRPRSLTDYCTRRNLAPLSDAINRNNNHNIVNVLYGRECAGPLVRRQAIPPNFYNKQELLRRTLGHLSAVYCVLFDRTGRYILTGADDLLVKLWSAIDGRLLTTFRGASAEITDIAVNMENTMLAAGSVDHILRVWDLQTASVIAVLSGHNGTITSVNFCPSPKSDLKSTKYLVTTSNDGSVAFWSYVTPRGSKPLFHSKPTQYHEKLRPGQAQMICASFSPGGIFLAAGSADHHVRVYKMGDDGPKRILEIESHTDTVDSIQWAHNGLRFVSGSKDGTALVWHFESSQWKYQKLLMSDRLTSCPSPDDDNKKLKVTMVSWDYSDQWIVTAVNDHTIKVWNAKTGKLHKVLRGHTDELYVLESHPKDTQILLSAGHDGQLFIWNIFKGEAIATFLNQIEGQGHGGIFDAKWSPDGTMIAATDSHGHILMFGFGAGHERLKMLPKELFFHTDYRPLIRDSNYYVLDEQTQLAPHLMPPPFLVDVDGNPYPPSMQRLVPGRENCPSEQLIPNIGIGMDGFEVDQARSEIDRLIEALANRQHGPAQDQPDNGQANSPRLNRPLRRNGDVEGVRQSSGNWQRDTSFKFIRRVYVRPMLYSRLQTMKQQVYAAGQQEHDLYRKEMRRRPLMINTGNPCSSSMVGPPKPRGRGRKRRTEGNQPSTSGAAAASGDRSAGRLQVSTVRRHTDDEELEESSSSESSNSDDSSDLQLSNTSSSDTESSEYSDWVAMEDQRQTLQPPKRSKRRPVEREAYSPESGRNRGKKGARKKIPQITNGEIPDEYKPPEWLSETVPKKQPYYPQMGDEVVYFRQGHERYLDWVDTKKLYNTTGTNEPWTQLELRDHEFCKVIGIKYEIRPPRLCCLKLALLTETGNLTDQSFTIKYHDIPDVLDFLVLKQTFDTAVGRNWGPGDRFRSMIDDKWWIGEIESHQPLSREFPDSLFMCFKVRWDNSEYEFMSPWDLEPIDEDRMPSNVGGGVPVLPEEIQALLYRPKSEEWPRGDRDGSCRRIVGGLEEVMGLAIADAFLTPVDLNAYPMYAFLIEYPIDLSTIKARFENHFYRRITSAQFDVRYLATNAEKFNEPHSNIVKNARIITDLCLRILRDYNEVDVPAVYHQLLDTYLSSESEDENQAGPSYRAGPSTSRSNGARRSRRLVPETDWRVQCRELLHMIWDSPDSEPFREPVDTLDHPDYLQIVETPMDLLTVREELRGDNYDSPLDFAKDMRLVFQNSRNYNTNKRSRIYAMTLRLSTLFETHIKILISHWKSAKRRSDAGQTPKKRGRPSRNNGAGPSTQQADDDDDDDDDFDQGPSRGTGRRATRLPNASNRVSSSNMREPQPGPSRRSGRAAASQNEGSNSDSTDSSSDSSNDTEESSGIPLAELGLYVQRKERQKRSKRSKRKRNAVSSSSRTPRKGRKPGRKRKKRQLDDEDEEVNVTHTDDEENCDNLSDNSNARRGRPKRRTKKRESQDFQEDLHDELGFSTDEDGRPRRNRKHRRYESDQSFHVEEPKAKRRTLDSEESDGENPRPTRESARKAFVKWSKAESEEEEEEDDFLQKPQTSSQSQSRGRGRRKKVVSDQEDVEESQEDDRAQAGPSGSRSQRLTRQRASQSQSQESDVDENGPSTSTNSRSKINGHSSSRATRSRDLQDTLTHQLRPHEEDHNYGGPGPSSYRNSRRVEETSEDPLGSRRRKKGPQKPQNAGSSSSNQGSTKDSKDSKETKRTMRTRTHHDYFEEEEEIDVVTVPTETQKRVKTIPPQPDPSDDSYSEDDNTPLKMVAAGSKGAQTSRTKNGNVQRVKRSIFTDDENSQNSGAGPSGTMRTRRLKRPHYNEETDEDKPSTNDNDPIGRRLKRRMVSSSPQRDQESDDSSDNEAGVSVSSRGRVRKITAKARGLFKE